MVWFYVWAHNTSALVTVECAIELAGFGVALTALLKTSKHGSELLNLTSGITTRESEAEHFADLQEYWCSRVFVILLLKVVPDLLGSVSSCRDSCDNCFLILHPNVPDCRSIIIDPVGNFLAIGDWSKSGGIRRMGERWARRLRGEDRSRDHLSDWSWLGIGPSNIGPHLVSHQKLRHSGRPEEPVQTVKDGDVSKSIFERHSDREARREHN